MIEDYLRTANIRPCGQHVELITLPGFTDSKTKRNILFGNSDEERIITYGYIRMGVMDESSNENNYIVVRTDQLYRLLIFPSNPQGLLSVVDIANKELVEQYAKKDEEAMTMLTQYIDNKIVDIKKFYSDRPKPYWLLRNTQHNFEYLCENLAKQYKKLSGNHQLIIKHIREWLERKENEESTNLEPSSSQTQQRASSPERASSQEKASSQENAWSPALASDFGENEHIDSSSYSENEEEVVVVEEEEEEEEQSEKPPDIVKAARFILAKLTNNKLTTTDTRKLIIDAFFELFEEERDISLRDGAIELLKDFPGTNAGGNKHKKHQKTRKNKIIISTKKSYSKQKNTRNKITVRRQHLVSKQKNTRSKRNLRTRKQVSKPKQKNTRKKRNR